MEKSENNKQYQSEIKTLSGNLGTLRFELETMKKRVREMEDNASIAQKRIQGKVLCSFMEQPFYHTHFLILHTN